MVKEWTDEDFAQETASGVTLTDFWATWCGPLSDASACS